MDPYDDETRDLSAWEDQIANDQDFEGASLVSSEEATYRSIPGLSGPLDMDVNGFGFEARSLGEYSGLSDAFAKQRPDLVPQNKSPSIAPTVFNVVEMASAPPSLTKDMCAVVCNTMVFCRAADFREMVACIRDILEGHDCFDGLPSPPGSTSVENSEWVWNFVHYSRTKFSIDLNVMFWTLDDLETVRSTFRACPKDANFAVEFQRLGGDSFAWLDLWGELLAGIEKNSRGTMQFTRNADPVKRRCLDDMDLLSDSEDDEGDEDVTRSLVHVMEMCCNNGLEGQLEALKTMCRMCETAGHCKHMASDEAFVAFAVKLLVDVHAKCVESNRTAPLLRCAASLLLSLAGSPGKNVISLDVTAMGVVASVLEDANMCPAVRCECAKLVLFLLSRGMDFAERDRVLEAVGASVNKSNGRKLSAVLAQVQSKLRSLSYR